MNQPACLLSIVILNYKNAELTLRCIETINKELPELAKQIIVVDNSGPETGATLRNAAASLSFQLIENPTNAGFARANNQGMKVAEGKFILILNNDAFITSECVLGGIEFLLQHENVGIWAPRLVGERGESQVTCSRYPSLISLLVEYWFRYHLEWYRGWQKWTSPVNVQSVIGAFQLIPHQVIKEVGLLDERFFFNVEDVDYCRRVTGMGYHVVYDPRYSVVHLGSASQNHRKWIEDPYLHKSRTIFFNKYHGPIGGLLARVIISAGLRIRKWSDL